MDSQLFRKETETPFRKSVNQAAFDAVARQIDSPSKVTMPVDDVRYPLYAAPMEDGRIITDYQPHCSFNVVQPKYGNSVREFLQHNATAIIQVSRKRQAETAGAQFHKAPTVEGPKTIQRCNEYDCTFIESDYPKSIGLARTEPLPSLFGTFSAPTQPAPDSLKPPITTVFEGGRNSLRGRQFTPLGLGPANPRGGPYGSSG
jgi:hypothetical protein